MSLAPTPNPLLRVPPSPALPPPTSAPPVNKPFHITPRTDGPIDTIWPHRLLHVASMTSYVKGGENTYNGAQAPAYNILNYTWGYFPRHFQHGASPARARCRLANSLHKAVAFHR
ncbi:hypothetical protein EJ04DRAFT_551646 [Polyplosphaeria fusca]|uniref:Uncharacterized protein n=1 Tax=Polyplosphaeria fusca TaxID=682080 RepID=A0A9P4V2U8_9PLEO|nr:hypothetical protein EJ04DRAFT_551646 [Polyplosphaeria fusca]